VFAAIPMSGAHLFISSSLPNASHPGGNHHCCVSHRAPGDGLPTSPWPRRSIHDTQRAVDAENAEHVCAISSAFRRSTSESTAPVSFTVHSAR
jgi:hypothetical protein